MRKRFLGIVTFLLFILDIIVGYLAVSSEMGWIPKVLGMFAFYVLFLVFLECYTRYGDL